MSDSSSGSPRSLTAAGAKDIVEGLTRLANCENIVEYVPGYINKELAARIHFARGILDRNAQTLYRIAADA